MTAPIISQSPSPLQSSKANWIEWILLQRNTGRTVPSSLCLCEDNYIQNKLTSQDEHKNGFSATGYCDPVTHHNKTEK